MSAKGKEFKVNVSKSLDEAVELTQTEPGTLFIPEGGQQIVFNGQKMNCLGDDDLNGINAKLNILYKVVLQWSAGGKNFKKGTTQKPSLTWTVKVNGQNVSPTSQKIKVGSGSEEVLGNDVRTYSVGSISSDTSVVLTVDGTTATASFKFYNPAYYGVVAPGFEVNETNIKALTELSNYGNNDYAAAAISGTNNTAKKICYAFPKGLGALTSIKDPDNQNWIDSFTCSEVSVNGEPYYVYLLTDPAGVEGLKYTYA